LEHVFESRPAAAARLHAAVEARKRAEIDEATAIAELAAEHEWPADAPVDVIGTRAVRLGADGTPMHDEFVALEVAVALGISVSAATWLVRDVVNLKARYPLVWFYATRALIPMFRARQLTMELAPYDLSLAEAQELDAQLAPKLPGLPWRRVLQLARGLVSDIAPDKVAALSQRARTERFVRKLPTDDPAVAYLSARLDTADAIFLDAMVDRIADILGERGDTQNKDARRARALGVLATPARAQLLLAEAAGEHGDIGADDPRLLPETQVYVHVAEETLLAGGGVARVEGVGPLAATMLSHLVGHSRIRLTPVIRPYAQIAVDSYEIPDRIRRQVLMRDTYEVFPYSSRPSRGKDFDHTIPYRPGGRRQTRASNLGPLSRRVHRAKTHGGWALGQPRPGIFWWTTPSGYCYRVGPTGTLAGSELLWNLDHRGDPPE
jgi:hypothetical protein